MRKAIASGAAAFEYHEMEQLFPEPKFVDAKGVKLAIYEANGDPAGERPPVILVHGWPEIAYSWKHILPALAGAGFRAIALDLKGFGRSDAPKDKTLYDIEHMTGDLAALLDSLDIERAVFCGHDWGGAIVWPMAQLHPARVAGVIGVSTPHRPPPPVAPLSIMEKRHTDRHYIVRFQEDGIPENILAQDPTRFFRLMFRRPKFREIPKDLDNRVFDLLGRLENGPPPNDDDVLLSDADIAVFVDAYVQSGFTGGVNLYRNIDHNWETMKTRSPVIEHPALWVGAASDIYLPPSGADGLEKIVPNVEKHIIPECGHWVMWEKPKELNALLVDWLLRKMPG